MLTLIIFFSFWGWNEVLVPLRTRPAVCVFIHCSLPTSAHKKAATLGGLIVAVFALSTSSQVRNVRKGINRTLVLIEGIDPRQ